MSERKLPPDDEVARLYESGMSHAAIAAELGSSATAVRNAVNRSGAQSRLEQSGYMPEGLLPDHWHAPAARMLRAHARREKGVRPLRGEEERRLDRWLNRLRDNDLVVAYDPETPPNEASPTYGGWSYVARASDIPRNA